MIWFFTRGGVQIDFEVRRFPETGAYALVINYPDGTERVEPFDDPRRLIGHVLRTQQRFIDDGWVPSSPIGRSALVPLPPPSKRRRYLRRARIVAVKLHRTVTRRLAAAFGL